MLHFIERDSLEAVVVAQWVAVIGRAPARLDEPFPAAGQESLRQRLGAVLGADVTADLVGSDHSVGAMATNLRAHGIGVTRRCWTLRQHGRGAPLVIAPNVGGNVVGLVRFAEERFDRPVLALQSQGFAITEDEPLTDIGDIAVDLADLVEQALPGRTCHLAGYCIGGVFAYELGDELRSRGWDVRSVMMINTSLDSTPTPYSELLTRRVRLLADIMGLALPAGAEPAPRVLFDVIQRARVPVLETELAAFERRTSVFASNWFAESNHVIKPKDLPVVLFSGPDRLDDHTDADGPVQRDWLEMDLSSLSIVDVASNTYDMLYDDDTLAAIEDVMLAREN